MPRDFDSVSKLISKLLPSIYVSRETFEQLARYESLLIRWQKKTNIVGPGTLEHFWQRHVVDSLQCLALFPEAQHWVDLGSGGGFPGLIIAQGMDNKRMDNKGMGNNGKTDIHLVEANGKKCSFLKQVIRETGIPATVHCQRIEAVIKQLDVPDIVTARALAPLDKLFGMTRDWVGGTTTGVFFKGKSVQTEIETAQKSWDFDCITHNSVLGGGSVILQINNLRKK